MPRRRTAGRRRPKGEGSVYQTKDGRWRAAYMVVAEDGTRKRAVVRGRDEEEARAKLDEVRKRAKLNPAKVIVKDSVEDYILRWLDRDRVRVKPSTYQHRRNHVVRHIIPAIGRTRLDRLTPAMVEDMTTDLMTTGKKPLSPRTVAHIRGTLRQALTSAMRDGLVTSNAAALAKPPRQQHVEMKTLNARQVRVLLASTKEGRYGALWALLVGAGLRINEALAITWDDVGLEDGVVHVRRSYSKAGPGRWEVSDTKTKRSRRRIELPATTVAALADLRDRQVVEQRDAGPLWQEYGHGQPLFTDQYGRIPEPTNFNRALTAALKAAGLPHIRVHDCRHTYATLLLEQGVPLVTVSRLLGHGSIAITADVYGHVGEGMRREAADVLDRVLE